LEQENARIREAFKTREAELERENDHIRELSRSKEAELEHEVQVLREHNRSLARSLGSILRLASTTLGGSCDDSVTTAGNAVRPRLVVSVVAHFSTQRATKRPCLTRKARPTPRRQMSLPTLAT
jgi:hypothetical protein